MHQILQIFRKDCRHFWPEILASLTILAAAIWLYPLQWLWLYPDSPLQPQGPFDPHRLKFLAQVALGLVPLTWFILIVRVVQDENLLGNRQFWKTRPYRWEDLLAEKSLFVAVFVCCPFLIAQAVELARAGFQPSHYLPGLFFNLIIITGIFAAPAFCLAAVFPNLSRTFFAIIAAAVLVAVIMFLSPSHGYPNPGSASIPSSDRFTIPLIYLFTVVILILQYSTHKLWLARALLLALPCTIGLVLALPLEQRLLPGYYPAPPPGQKEPFHIQLDSVAGDNGAAYVENSQYVSLRLPLIASNIPPGHVLQVDDLRLTIKGRNGPSAATTWQSAGIRFARHTPRESLNVSVLRSVLDSVQAQAANLTVELAITELAPGSTTYLRSRDSRTINLPGVGICDNAATSYSVDFHCLVPLNDPPLAKVILDEQALPCSAAPAFRVLEEAWSGVLQPDPADLGLTSVWARQLYFQAVTTAPSLGPDYGLCPGAPIAITRFHLVRRFQYSFRQDALMPRH